MKEENGIIETGGGSKNLNMKKRKNVTYTHALVHTR